MKRLLTSGVILLCSMCACSQNAQKPKLAPAAAKQEAEKKAPPTLHVWLADEDAALEELKLKKQLPGNQRAMHEAALMNEFMEGFKNSKECNGITFYLKTDKEPDFAVHISVAGPDDPKSTKQTWDWILVYHGDPLKSRGIRSGSQSTAKLTARDVCMTVWDKLDFNKPGGKIE